jgi:large subunit ribosomal protein L4
VAKVDYLSFKKKNNMATTKKTPAVKKATKTVKKTVAVKPAKASKVAVKKEVNVKESKKTAVKAVVASEVHGLTMSVLGVDGKATGKMTMPAEVFGEKINDQLIKQAIRVYLANQRQGGANTKTRGEVEGSTRKIYKQKGTGRARHGSIRAHIFVGGGIVFGPVTHDFSLTMPTKMKRKALASALTQQYQAGNVVVVDGLEGLKPKTKFMAEALGAVTTMGSVLLVVTKDNGKVERAARNIEGVDLLPAHSVNTYDVLAHKKVVFMKDAIAVVKENVTKKA